MEERTEGGKGKTEETLRPQELFRKEWNKEIKETKRRDKEKEDNRGGHSQVRVAGKEVKEKKRRTKTKEKKNINESQRGRTEVGWYI